MLGLDDDTSHDHDWGLRLTVLVDENDVGRVDAALEAELPGVVARAPHPVRHHVGPGGAAARGGVVARGVRAVTHGTDPRP